MPRNNPATNGHLVRRIREFGSPPPVGLGRTAASIAKEYSLNVDTVRKILRRETWVGEEFEPGWVKPEAPARLTPEEQTAADEMFERIMKVQEEKNAKSGEKTPKERELLEKARELSGR